MDNKKIGKLIAKLRNEKGLTQQKLGDKVGVGFRAVSKWERGITMPDIGIINELSKILGITSDELLSGELKETNEPKTEEVPKEKEKKKTPLKIKITISLIISVILIFISVFVYYNNKTYTYTMISANEDKYVVKGLVTFDKDNISIILNELYFIDAEFSSTMIKNYEYDIYIGNKFTFNYGYNPDGSYVEKIQSINDFEKKFRINYNGEVPTSREKILKTNILIVLTFLDKNNQEITKEIEISLYEQINNK